MAKKNRNSELKKDRQNTKVDLDVMEVDECPQNVSNEDIEISNSKSDKTNETVIGFTTDKDLLDEINYRISLTDKNVVLLKHLPKTFSRNDLTEYIPDIITCRFPESRNSTNKGLAFVQMKSENAVDKCISDLNGRVIDNRSIVATKLNVSKTYNSLKCFDLTKLHFNGIKPRTKKAQIKQLYPNAELSMPQNDDKSSKGWFTLSFKTEAEAKSAFVENKLNLEGVKVQLNFVIKNSGIATSKYSFSNTDELLEEVKKRLKFQCERTVILKNLPKAFTLKNLRELVPNAANCRYNQNKKTACIVFENVESASDAVKKFNKKEIQGVKLRALINVISSDVNSLENLELNKLHISNLRFSAKKDDICKLFPKAEIDFPVNEDNTSCGYCTALYLSAEDALIDFDKEPTIDGNILCVNFVISSSFLAVKETPLPVNSKVNQKKQLKRSLNSSDVSDNDNSQLTKRLKQDDATDVNLYVKPVQSVKKVHVDAKHVSHNSASNKLKSAANVKGTSQDAKVVKAKQNVTVNSTVPVRKSVNTLAVKESSKIVKAPQTISLKSKVPVKQPVDKEASQDSKVKGQHNISLKSKVQDRNSVNKVNAKVAPQNLKNVKAPQNISLKSKLPDRKSFQKSNVKQPVVRQ